MTVGSAPPLELRGLTKSFGAVQALRDVDLSVRGGEIHGLVGQNGSGKSTLVKVLAGLHTPDRGSRVLVHGRELSSPTRLSELREGGIAIVHQDLGLIPGKSVAENIAVGNFRARRWSRRIDWRREQAEAGELLERLHVRTIAPATLVGRLSPADRSIVAIARALRNQQDGGGVIVLDEATRALPQDALEDFYRVLRGVAASGGSALLISHHLDEVMSLTDRVTVLRDGRVVDSTTDTSSITERDIARRMLGRDADPVVHRRSRPPSPDGRATVSGLSGAVARDIEFRVDSGEVVGLTGVAGSGWDEMPYLVSGARRARSGTLRLGGTPLDLRRAGTRRFIRAGVALVPEHRIEDGLALTLPITHNITLPRATVRGRAWWIGASWQLREAQQVISRLGVRPAVPDLPVGKLSGGNQQKVLLGKWLAGSPQLLVLHEPTQAVDVGAREDILRAISAAAEDRIAVLIASIQPADLAAVCDRVLVFRDGRVVAKLTHPHADEIVEAVYAGSPTPSSREA